MNVRKLFLYLLIASVAVSAVIGIVVIIIGDFGEFETRVLLTALTVTVTSVLGLACGACLEAGRLRIIPLAGIGFALISAVLWMVMIWAEHTDNSLFGKCVITATLLSLASSHISLLSLARLDPRFIWSKWAVHLVVWPLTALILWTVWFKVDPSQPLIARTMGVLAVILGALTVVTPIFHRLSAAESGDEIEAEIARLEERIAELEKKRERLRTASADR